MFTPLTTATYQDAIANSSEAVIACIKKLCPHCKNMEKVLEKFSAQHSQVKLFTIDLEDEADAAAALQAERAPTILVVKGGKVVATKAGLMNPREMTAFYSNAK